VSEFDYVHDEPQVAVIQSALSASTHVLAKRPAELATQLIGRVPDADRLDLQEFFAGLRSAAPRPWLRPLTASLATPALLRVIHVDSMVRAVAVTGDVRRIVSVDNDDTQTVWDVDNGVPLRRVRWNHGPTTSLSIGATRPFVVTTVSAQGAVMWAVETGECLERDGTPRHSRPPSLAVEMESEHVVWWSHVSGGPVWLAITERKRSWSGGDQHEYSTYLGDAGRTIRIAFRFSDFSFSAAAIAPNRLRLITCSFPTGTVVWDVEYGKQIGTIPGDQIQAVACDSEGEFVVTGSYRGIISLWKIDSLLDSRCNTTVHRRSVVDAQVSKNETLGFTVSVDGTANTWDLHIGTVVASIAPEASTASDVDWHVMSARIDVDKGQVDFLVRDSDFRWAMGDVNSYDLATGASVPSPVGPLVSLGSVRLTDDKALFRKSPVDLGASVASSSTRPLCISSDGTRGVTVSRDNTIWLWDVSTGTRIASFGVDSTPSCCACTARAETLIVGEESGRVHILRLEEQAESG
jgi:WD40 repeat protein